MLALVMGTGVAAHVYLKATSPNPKWLIFMTNQVEIHLKQTRYKSILNKPGTNLKQRTCSFSGHGLAGPSLHSTCLVGPEGQALVDLDFLCLRLSFVSNKTKYVTSYLLEFFSHSRGSTFKEGTLPFLYKLSWALEVLTFRADHMHFLWPPFLKIDAHVIQTHMNTNTLCEIHTNTLCEIHPHTLCETQTNKPPPEYGLHCRLAGHSALLDLDLSLFCGVLLPQGFGAQDYDLKDLH